MTIPSGTAKWAWSFRGSDIARVPGAVQRDNSAPLIRDLSALGVQNDPGKSGLISRGIALHNPYAMD